MNQTPRYRYVIGDLQGCYAAFCELLEHIKFDEHRDKLYLCGDIVARGEDSLGCLRLVKTLADKGALQTVLGNHDITLLAVWQGVMSAKPKDKTAEILKAQDCEVLMQWLRKQPFLIEVDDKTVITHAGIPPMWTTKEAKDYAKALSERFSGDLKAFSTLLPKLYDKTPKIWGQLVGDDRLCAISDYLTRMRLIDKHGRLDFTFKEGLDAPMPAGYRPWFDWVVARDERVLFGHWAALEARVRLPYAYALDGGAVWGGRLLAYRLEDNQEFWVKNPKI